MTVGVILGEGFYSQSVTGFGSNMKYGEPGVILQLEIEFRDGSSHRIVTNSSWRASAGPILKNNVYAGEVYDARHEISGWDKADFDDKEWIQAEAVKPLSPRLEPQLLPPIKRIKTINPIKLSNPKPGLWVYDMGQNFAGWARLKVKAKKGTGIMLRFGEWIESEGLVNFDSTGHFATGVIQSDMYICKGSGLEIWEPRFTYHGFRYVEMTSYPCRPTLNMLEGIVVRTSVKQDGQFTCSDELINRVHRTVLWTEESNLHSIPSDCPHRERSGWLGDAHVSVEMSIYNYGMAQFWRKFVRDIETTSDLKDGVPAAVAPGKRKVGKPPDWGVATILLPWYQYLYYDDQRLLEEHYDYMVRFCDYFYRLSDNWIVSAGLGDWCDPVAYPGAERIGGGGKPQNTSPALTSTAYFYVSAKIMKEVASLLARQKDANKHLQWALEIKKAFNDRFYDKKTKHYGSQTAAGLALYMVLVPEGEEKEVAQRLARDVRER